MYVLGNETDTNNLYQGDIIKDFPFFFIKEDFSVYQAGSTTKIDSLKIDEIPAEAGALVPYKISRVIILSHTCDAQRREQVIIAPIHKIKDYENEGILNKNKIDSIKKRKIFYWFYLPAVESLLDESLVDFQSIMYIPRIFLERFKSKKMLSMSDWGRHHLGWALNNYFGRPIEDKEA